MGCPRNWTHCFDMASATPYQLSYTNGTLSFSFLLIRTRSVNTGCSLSLSGCVTETGLSALRPGNRKRSTCGSDSITLTVSVGETEDVTSTQWSKNSTQAIWNRQLFLSLSEGGEWFKLISVKRYERSKLRGSGVELKPKWSKWYKCHLSLGWTLAWTLSPTSFSLGKKSFDWKMTHYYRCVTCRTIGGGKPLDCD